MSKIENRRIIWGRAAALAPDTYFKTSFLLHDDLVKVP